MQARALRCPHIQKFALGNADQSFHDLHCRGGRPLEMGVNTEIGFCDSTTNLQMGCDGCELWNGRDRRECYAGNLTTRYAGRPGWPIAFDQPRRF
jgi:hypothetical protein